MRCFALFAAVTVALPATSPAQTAADSAGIRAAALDYIEGWYEANPEGRSMLGQMSALSLVQGVRSGGGRNTPAAEQQKDVTILDIYQNAASARIVASGWIDFLHLAKWNGRWVIVNVLWELKPQAPSR